MGNDICFISRFGAGKEPVVGGKCIDIALEIGNILELDSFGGCYEVLLGLSEYGHIAAVKLNRTFFAGSDQ